MSGHLVHFNFVNFACIDAQSTEAMDLKKRVATYLNALLPDEENDMQDASRHPAILLRLAAHPSDLEIFVTVFALTKIAQQGNGFAVI